VRGSAQACHQFTKVRLPQMTGQSNISGAHFCRRLLLAASLAALTTLAACALSGQRNTSPTKPMTGASAEPPSEKLVLTGTVTAISQAAGKGPSLRPWAVTIRVEKVKVGKFSHPEFTFSVHSPSMAGLEVGGHCTIEANWTGHGYLVDDMRWMGDKDAGR
jgi:hypothetical protein